MVGPVDFPEKYENLMRVAQQALAQQNLGKAKELFTRAYELKQTFEANSLLVYCLYELDEKQEALSQAVIHETEYLKQEEFATFYFDLLIGAKDWLYARKLIAATNFSEHFEHAMIEKIQQAENFSGQLARQKIRQTHQKLANIAELSPTQQLTLISELEQLPYHEFIQATKKILIRTDIHLFVRAKLLELLVQVGESKPVAFLTIDEQLIEVVPQGLPKPAEQKSYRCLSKLAQAYENQDALLSAGLKEEFMMQAAITYPIFDTYIGEATRWFEETIKVYQGTTEMGFTEVEEEKFLAKREKILYLMQQFL
ncbi:hypothetical protein [Enterococcus sp. DIV0125]|uniref:hypothetical protein n=1 Tax=Enterococcus sp. DIV0125 TaxID=2774796 RepID=UPI003D2FF988